MTDAPAGTGPLVVPRQVAWTQALSVGVDEIDAQHQELFRRIGLFFRALEEKRGAAELEPLALYLRQYVREHFAEEQRLMEFSGYPELGEHLESHQRLEADLHLLSEELRRTGPTLGLARRLVALLNGWMVEHVGTTDRRFGRFLATFLGRRSVKPSA